jgi:hypothetical protein
VKHQEPRVFQILWTAARELELYEVVSSHDTDPDAFIFDLETPLPAGREIASWNALHEVDPRGRMSHPEHVEWRR